MSLDRTTTALLGFSGAAIALFFITRADTQPKRRKARALSGASRRSRRRRSRR